MIVLTDEEALSFLSDNIKRLMGDMKISQLARETGDPTTTLWNVVSGSNMPRAGVIVRIATVLGVTVDELFAKPSTPAKSRRLKQPA